MSRLHQTSSLALLLIVSFFGAAFAQTQPSVTVRPASPSAEVRPAADTSSDVVLLIDGRHIEAAMVETLRGGQVMVWLRELEKLGWGAIEADPSGEVRFLGKSVTLVFTKGQGVAKVNSLAVRLPVDTYTKDGKLMVPLSFVAKALGFEYEAAPKTVVTIKPHHPAGMNSIVGRVLYNGKGVEGATVRLVDPDFAVVKNISAKTDAKGDYTLSPVPDGKFMAYVYTGDNPAYFNRASKVLDVGGGKQAQAEPLSLGRILAPLQPKPGSDVSLAKPQIEFKWAECPGAASYSFHIGLVGKLVPDIDAKSQGPSVSIASTRLEPGLSYYAEVTALNASGEFMGGTALPGGKQWTFNAARLVR